jgi:hypothetical protein
LSIWIREHRDGATTAKVAEVANSGGMYVAYATGPNGVVSALVDGRDGVEVAQAAADRATSCPQPCVCSQWSEVANSHVSVRRGPRPLVNRTGIEMTRVPPRRFEQPATVEQQPGLTNLESLLSWATSLLTIAKHDTMKATLRVVIGDLKDGLQLLRKQNAHDAPTVWTMVDVTAAQARTCLRMVADAFQSAGPNAEFRSAGER